MTSSDQQLMVSVGMTSPDIKPKTKSIHDRKAEMTSWDGIFGQESEVTSMSSPDGEQNATSWDGILGCYAEVSKFEWCFLTLSRRQQVGMADSDFEPTE